MTTYQAFMYQSNGYNGGIEAVKLSASPRSTKVEAEQDIRDYEARSYGRGEGPSASAIKESM